jgi:hypothetical protein
MNNYHIVYIIIYILLLYLIRVTAPISSASKSCLCPLRLQAILLCREALLEGLHVIQICQIQPPALRAVERGAPNLARRCQQTMVNTKPHV